MQIYTERNTNAALVVAAGLVAVGTIVTTAIVTSHDESWRGIANTAGCGLLGVVLLAAAFVVMDRLTPGKLGAICTSATPPSRRLRHRGHAGRGGGRWSRPPSPDADHDRHHPPARDRAAGRAHRPAPVGPRLGRAVLLFAAFVCAACGLVYELALVTLGSSLVGDGVRQVSLVPVGVRVRHGRRGPGQQAALPAAGLDPYCRRTVRRRPWLTADDRRSRAATTARRPKIAPRTSGPPSTS